MTTIHRDPFARGEYKRFCTTNTVIPLHSCRWCGQTPKRLYSYVWWSDARDEPWDDSGKWFCNLQCFHAYEG